MSTCSSLPRRTWQWEARRPGGCAPLSTQSDQGHNPHGVGLRPIPVARSDRAATSGIVRQVEVINPQRPDRRHLRDLLKGFGPEWKCGLSSARQRHRISHASMPCSRSAAAGLVPRALPEQDKARLVRVVEIKGAGWVGSATDRAPELPHSVRRQRAFPGSGGHRARAALRDAARQAAGAVLDRELLRACWYDCVAPEGRSCTVRPPAVVRPVGCSPGPARLSAVQSR